MPFYSETDFEPDRALGYLVRIVHQMGAAALEPLFVEEGLTGTQWSVLISIWFDRSRTSADLARDLNHDKGAMTRLVDALEERGWVTRQRCTDDRRAVNLALTPAGQAIALKARGRVIDRWNDWLEDWDREDVSTLIGLLRKLRDTLAAATVERTGA